MKILFRSMQYFLRDAGTNRQVERNFQNFIFGFRHSIYGKWFSENIFSVQRRILNNFLIEKMPLLWMYIFNSSNQNYNMKLINSLMKQTLMQSIHILLIFFVIFENFHTFSWRPYLIVCCNSLYDLKLSNREKQLSQKTSLVIKFI